MNDTCPAEQAIYLFITIKRSNSQHIYPIATIDPANPSHKDQPVSAAKTA